MTLLIEAADRFQPVSVASVEAVNDNLYRPTGLVLPTRLSYEKWAMIGTTLSTMEQGINWWIGDWLNYGETAYGDKYTQAILETGRDRQSLADLAWVARSIEISRRRENLTWSHHREVAPLAPEMADRLLDLAEHEKLSIRGIRDAVQSARKELSPTTQQMALGAGPETDTISQSLNGNGGFPAPPIVEVTSPVQSQVPKREKLPVVEPEDDGFTAEDLGKTLEDAQERLLRLQAERDSLNVSDKDAEIVRLHDQLARLDRLRDADKNKLIEQERIIKSQRRTLESASQLLGVTSFGEIIGAIQDLMK